MAGSTRTPEPQAVQIVCLDLEGVLVPEIWIAFSERTGIPELRRTTRDEPDYDKLMRFRLDLLRRHGLGLKDLQQVIAGVGPEPGGKGRSRSASFWPPWPWSSTTSRSFPVTGPKCAAARCWQGSPVPRASVRQPPRAPTMNRAVTASGRARRSPT